MFAERGNMTTTLERTFTLDRDLTRRAERKLHRYGRTLDDAVAYVLASVVSSRGEPMFPPVIALDFTVNGVQMEPRLSARLAPIVETSDGIFSVHLDEIGLDAFSESRDGLVAEVKEQLAMLWKEYALADDSDLTESAQKVKRNLLAMFEETGNA
jgi:hypothetical protein